MIHIPVTLLLLSAASVFGQTSLYIPGFDPQPISADVLGVDPQGRTTWGLHPGAPTDTNVDSGFVGTVTLVEGPSDAVLTYADPEGQFTVGIACSLSDNIAVCSKSSGGAVETETISRFAIQGGTTASAAPTGSDAQTSQTSESTSTPTSTSSGTTRQTSQASQTSGSTSAPAATSNEQKLMPYFTGLLILTGLVVVSI